MKQFYTMFIVWITSIFYMLPAQGAMTIDLYQDLAVARDMAFLTDKEDRESMPKALAVLIGCNLDELCSMMVMSRMSTNEDNLLYIHFHNKLNRNRDDFMYRSMHCVAPELTRFKKTQASCLVALKDKLSDPTTRAKGEESLGKCLRSRVFKLAKTNNIFARDAMFNYELRNQNEKGINFWYDKMQLLLPTLQYHTYAHCKDK